MVVEDDAIENVIVTDVMINREENVVREEVILQRAKEIDEADAQTVLNQDVLNLHQIDLDVQDDVRQSWLGF